MRWSPWRIALALLFVFVGFFGVAFAVAGVLVPLPAPAAGGTCGPGTSSEAPISALLNPVSIGAGVEPPANQAAARRQWTAFVSECQSSADHRGVAAVLILVLSLVVGILGPKLVLRRKRPAGPPVWSPYPSPYPSPQPSTIPSAHPPVSPATDVLAPSTPPATYETWGALPER